MPTAGVTMTVSGVTELLGAFEELGKIGARAAMQAAAKKAAVPIANAARRLAPRSGENGTRTALADSIVIRSSLSRSQQRKRGGRRAEAETFVGSTAPHAHLVEFGHLQVAARHEGEVHGLTKAGKRTRFTGKAKKTKRVVGHVPAHPFMRPAYDSTKMEATRILVAGYGEELERIGKRYAAQARRGKLTRGSREAFRMELGL